MVSEHPCLGSSPLRFGSRKKIPTLTVTLISKSKFKGKEQRTHRRCLGLAGKVRRHLRPRSFVSIPVRIGKPKHRMKNRAVEGEPCLRHGRRERFPFGGKDTATPILLCSTTLRRPGVRKRRVAGSASPHCGSGRERARRKGRATAVASTPSPARRRPRRSRRRGRNHGRGSLTSAKEQEGEVGKAAAAVSSPSPAGRRRPDLRAWRLPAQRVGEEKVP
jgi:hypothetical protein